VGDDVADVPMGEEVEYDFHSPENLPEVRFDNAAGAGQGYIRFQFSRVDFPGTVFTHGLSEVFRWHAPDGTQFVTAVNCPMTIDTPHEGPGSSLTGHAVCDMVSGSTEVTVYSKFNYTE